MPVQYNILYYLAGTGYLAAWAARPVTLLAFGDVPTLDIEINRSRLRTKVATSERPNHGLSPARAANMRIYTYKQLYFFLHANFAGSRSTFEFPSWVNLSGPRLYCTLLYGQD